MTMQTRTIEQCANGWLDAADWERVQRMLPIACVDVLPCRTSGEGRLQIGLILRQTPDQGLRWCLIGGRLFQNESFAAAVSRQLLEALGTDIQFTLTDAEQPLFVAQYFREQREIGGWDSRQHAIGLVFSVPLSGTIRPWGEAIQFEWFGIDDLPAADEFGFGQDKIVARCVSLLGGLSQGR